MKSLDGMNKLVADLAVFNTKLHNVHWNVVGAQFVAIHGFTEQVYNEVFLQYDEVAEAVKMRGNFPVASMKEQLAIAQIKELVNTSYTTTEALNIVLEDMKYIKDTASSLRLEADRDVDFEVVGIMENLVSTYNKHIWFVESMLKQN